MKTKELDFYKFVSSPKAFTRRPFIEGVYHENGYKIATNGKVLVKVKADYPKKFELQTVSKELTYIDGQFPNYTRVIPEMSELTELKDDLADYLKIYKSLKPQFAIQKKLFCRASELSYLGISDTARILKPVVDQVMHFIECYPNAKLYAKPDKPTSVHLLYDENADALMVFMPASDPVEVIGFCLLNDEPDKVEFDSVMKRLGKLEILERLRLGNETEKDKKFIEDVITFYKLIKVELQNVA